MRKLILALVVLICGLPIYSTYQLNASVAHLKGGAQGVPFFAYYRYGVMPSSVVFNITTTHCTEAVGNVVPAFRSFVASLEDVQPNEIRLAWNGQTVAILNVTAYDEATREVQWDSGYSLATLAQAVRCSADDQLVIDWMVIKTDGSLMV